MIGTSRWMCGLILPLALACATARPAVAPEASADADDGDDWAAESTDAEDPDATEASTAPAAPREFPSAQDLQELADATYSTQLFAADEEAPEGWKLKGELAAGIEALPRSPEGPLEALLEGAAQKRPGLVLVSEGMRCMARQLGVFFLARRRQPTQALREFMATRCGTPAVNVTASYLHGDVPDDAPDDEVHAAWRESLERMLERNVSGASGAGAASAGLWFGRESGYAVLVLATGQRQVQVEPFPLRSDAAGLVRFSGELLIPAARVQALVNRGQYGFAKCETDPEVALPRFVIRCPVDRRDERAWLELAAFPAGRLLGRTVLRVLAWPKGRMSAAYRSPRYGPRRPVSSESELGRGLLAQLNEVRSAAGLGALTQAGAQSRTAARVAPHYFSALAGQATETVADRVALGLRAGWEIDGTVQYGRFTAGSVTRGRDATALLSSMLSRPYGRYVLLDPEASQVAVGPVMADESETIATVMGTYALFDSRQHDRDAEAVLKRIRAAREAEGLSAPVRIEALRPLTERAARDLKNTGAGAKAALDALLAEAAEQLRQPVTAWALHAIELDELELPTELLTMKTVELDVAVAHLPPDDGPWGQFVVLVVVALPKQDETAMLGSGGPW